MTGMTRRVFLGAAGTASFGLAACATADKTMQNMGVNTGNADQINARVDSTREFLLSKYPGTRDLETRAAGVLWMPLVTEAGLLFGGSYGRGALRINNVTVDYYAMTGVSYGFQLGAQQYAHALFFMSAQALEDFRRSQGWTAGADMTYATPDIGGGNMGGSTTQLSPVVALIFGQQGLMAGVSLEGSKYSRVIP